MSANRIYQGVESPLLASGIAAGCKVGGLLALTFLRNSKVSSVRGSTRSRSTVGSRTDDLSPLPASRCSCIGLESLRLASLD